MSDLSFNHSTSVRILAISGSSSQQSSNQKLLYSIKKLFPEAQIAIAPCLSDLPLFTAEKQLETKDIRITAFIESIQQSEAVIISSPEYLHSIPAALKNALEWCTHSGCFYQKQILLISFTPHAPRGQKLRKHLSDVLRALEARCVAVLDLYRNELIEKEEVFEFDDAQKSTIEAAIHLLK